MLKQSLEPGACIDLPTFNPRIGFQHIFENGAHSRGSYTKLGEQRAHEAIVLTDQSKANMGNFNSLM